MAMLLLPFLTSLLLILAFSRNELGWLVFFALIPLVHWWWIGFKNGYPTKQLVLVTWFSGLITCLAIMSFMLGTKPELWAGVPATPVKWLQAIAWMGSGLALSSGWLLFGLLIVWLKPNIKVLWRFGLAFAFAWVTSEFLRSVAMSIMWWSPSSTTGPHWNFGALGLGASTTGLVSASRIVGLFGLSFLVVATNLALYGLFYKKYRLATITAVIIMALLLLAKQPTAPKNRPTEVAAVQLNYDDDYSPQDLANYLLEQPAAQSAKPQLLVLPEYTTFLDRLAEPQRQAFLAEFFGEQTGAVVYTRSEAIGERSQDRVVYIDQSGKEHPGQVKSFLVPGGEYMPRFAEVLLKAARRPELLEQYNETRGLHKGTEVIQPLQISGTSVGVLPCSGAIAPELYRSLANQGADILVNSASLQIFSNAKSYFEQARGMARFHAVANNRPFVQSAQGGPIYIVDSDGDFLASSDPKGKSLSTATLSLGQVKTVYTKYGDYPVLIVSAVALLVLGFLRPKSKA